MDNDYFHHLLVVDMTVINLTHVVVRKKEKKTSKEVEVIFSAQFYTTFDPFVKRPNGLMIF